MIAATARAEERPHDFWYVWSQARSPSSLVGEEAGNAIVEVGSRQGLEWPTGSRRIRPEAFLDEYVGRDRKHFDYNNKFILAPGVAARVAATSDLNLLFGVKYEWDRRSVSKATYEGLAGFVAWEFFWPTDRPLRRLTVSSQGELRYPSSQEPGDRGDGLLQGQVEANYDLWSTASGRVRLAGFGELSLKTDKKGIDHYNTGVAGLGVKVRTVLTPADTLEVGAKLQGERWFETGEERGGSSVFVNLVWGRW